MIAHIITNPTRPVVNETLYSELDRQGIDAKLWEPVYDANDVVRSINLSHKRIIRFAVEHHIPEICIMEEDVMFQHQTAGIISYVINQQTLICI